MSLRTIGLKSIYRSDDGGLLESFYLPALSATKRYDRAVGFFSAAMLAYAAEGLGPLIRNEGRMRLLIGHPLEDDEYDAVKAGTSLGAVTAQLKEALSNISKVALSDLLQYRLRLLSYLVATNRLEVRLCIKRKGMYHEKVGVMVDKLDDCIVFHGSANETPYALLPGFNSESIAVYPSWNPEVFELYGRPMIAQFERLWMNQVEGSLVCELPSEIYEQFMASFPIARPPDPSEETDLAAIALLTESKSDTPRIPKSIAGNRYALKAHQERALAGWKANGYRGIFALATGTGKTIAALHGATRLCEVANLPLAVVVAVPYQNLADQWVEAMEAFGHRPIRCYESTERWRPTLQDQISNFNLKSEKTYLAIVVVNKTLFDSAFQEEISKVQESRLVFIGDECHHHNNESRTRALPNARFRLGLSATPYPHNNPELAKPLAEYYGALCAKYSLQDAIGDGVLAPYKYHLLSCVMDDVEYDEYSRLSERIAKILSIAEGDRSPSHREALKHLLLARGRVVGSIDDKVSVLQTELGSRTPSPFSLFYCGDGSVSDDDTEPPTRDIDRISTVAVQHQWRVAKFTSRETAAQRRLILRDFRLGLFDALVSIRVLDEGIDIPACQTAFLLASSRNPRQFIQRRGRILRRDKPDKTADIYDFFVAPPPQVERTSTAKALIRGELGRAIEFARSATNRVELEGSIVRLAKAWGLEGFNHGVPYDDFIVDLEIDDES